MVPLLLIQLSSAAAAVLVADACNTFYVGADDSMTVAGDDLTFSVVADDQSFDVEGCE
jgi:hypothetical protein